MIHLRECRYLYLSHFKTPVETPSVSTSAHEAESSVCSRCVEVGSGSGYITCSVALLLQHLGVTAHCIATDINPAALLATEHTLHAHNVSPFQVPYPLIDAALFSPFPSTIQQPYKHVQLAVQVASRVDLVHSDLLLGLRQRLHGAVDLLVTPTSQVCPHREILGIVSLEKPKQPVVAAAHRGVQGNAPFNSGTDECYGTSAHDISHGMCSGVQSALCAHTR